MLLLVGLGLAPPGSVSVEAWEALQTADIVYLENYTNLGITPDELAEFLKRPVLPAPRGTVESEVILQQSSLQTIALCVIGDVFTATTHSVLYLDCLTKHVPVKVFQNAGIMNVIAMTGLELYKFGQTVSVPYPMAGFEPTSYLARISANQAAGLHTLCLLDIKADEGRFMTIAEGAALLRKDIRANVVIGVAKLGTENHVFAGTWDEIAVHAWPEQPHSIVIPGALNAVESEFLEIWKNI